MSFIIPYQHWTQAFKKQNNKNKAIKKFEDFASLIGKNDILF